MIDPPPLLTVRRRFSRPSKALVAEFAKLSTSMIADAQGGRGGLDYRLGPMLADSRFAGPAVTAWCGPGDNLAALAALEIALPGDVIVIACDGFDGAGVIGDRFAGMAGNKGIGGIVVDGPVRDLLGIRRAGVPCYARGVTATSAYSSGPGSVGMPVTVGGVPIDPGDLIVADGETLVAVPRRRLSEVKASLVKVNQSEAMLDEAIAAGETGFGWVRDLLDSSRTRYLDK